MLSRIKQLFGFLNQVGVINPFDVILWLIYLIGCMIITAITFVRGDAHCVGYFIIVVVITGHTALILIRLLVWCWKREALRQTKKKLHTIRRRMKARLVRETSTMAINKKLRTSTVGDRRVASTQTPDRAAVMASRP